MTFPLSPNFRRASDINIEMPASPTKSSSLWTTISRIWLVLVNIVFMGIALASFILASGILSLSSQSLNTILKNSFVQGFDIRSVGYGTDDCRYTLSNVTFSRTLSINCTWILFRCDRDNRVLWRNMSAFSIPCFLYWGCHLEHDLVGICRLFCPIQGC